MSFKYAKIIGKYLNDLGEIGKITEVNKEQGICLKLADGTTNWFNDQEIKMFNPFVSENKRKLCWELLQIMRLENHTKNPVIQTMKKMAYEEMEKNFQTSTEDFQVLLYRCGEKVICFEEYKKSCM